MKDQTVFVRISGQAGTGKTTLAVKLARVLKEYGIESETWEYDDSCQQDLTDEALNTNLKSLGSKIKVIIQTEQIKRHLV